MRCYSVFLASFFFILATIAIAETPSTTDIATRDGVTSGKQLRNVDAEERGMLSSIKSWYRLAAGKSDDQVKKALKITDATAKNHPNYKKLEKFRYKREGREMDELIGVPTAKFCDHVGLARMTEAERKNSDAMREYVRYATKYDDAIWRNYMYNGLAKPPRFFGGSSAEMKVN